MNIEKRTESSTKSLCGSTQSLSSSEPKPSKTKVVKRRIRAGKKYHHVQNNIRRQLINRVEKKGEKIIEVAKELNIKYSTAKSILKVYRSEGRTTKIPMSQRYLSLRNMGYDYEKPEQRKKVSSKNLAQRAEKKPNLTLDESAPSYRGPQTRLRANKTQPKDQDDSDDAKRRLEETYEPPIRKKQAQETPSRATRNRREIVKEDIASESHFKHEEQKSQIKREKSLESEQPKIEESFNQGSMNIKQEHIFEQKQEENASLTGLNPMISSQYLHPLPPPYYQQAYLSSVMILKAQQMALQFQALRYSYLSQRTLKNPFAEKKND